MNNNIDNEATRFPESVNEQIGANSPSAQTPPPIPASETAPAADNVVVTQPTKTTGQPRKKSSGGGSVAGNIALGAGAGVLMGAGATVLMGMKKASDAVDAVDSNDNNHSADSGSHPAWSDGEVPVAHSVNDNMSFSQAFAAARAEVGPGGAFEWHGGVYGTYYASEWNNMSAAEKAKYESHFSWNHLDSDSHHASTVHHTSTTTTHHTSESTTTTSSSETHTHDPKIGGEDDVNVVSVNHNSSSSSTATTSTQTTTTQSGGEEGGVEVIGVYHDDNSGYNVGVMNVNNHNAMVIDVDGDLTFDVLAVDMNNDGKFSDDEMTPLTDGKLTVADLGGFTEGAVADDNNNLVAERGVEENQDDIVGLAQEVPGESIEEISVEETDLYMDTEDPTLSEDIDGLPNPDCNLDDDYLGDTTGDMLADDPMIDGNMDTMV